ncbi:osmoprotectant transport system substrate-binding protein [Kineococcus xinjiangensis]|uniref:Osmoprotectant transport system substrate-binding protein n=1 Tax=Kineococcus xinjiangensis TaxID=512762 RepID=A0A2S6IGV2_9ACTN|nr:ABC transporter substrate-binding protein [Kineococcus xinjiangensis]PPK93439.1 osmoprotectant transport system substrate-binding protein [Kineococcus xinjiangensis]
MRRRALLVSALAGSAVVLASCSSPAEVSGNPSASSSPSGSASEAGELVVGGSTASEMAIMQNIYAELLRAQGYEVTIKPAGERAVYAKALQSGEVDVVPEYAASLAEYLNRTQNGEDAAPVATSDAATTVEALRPLAEEAGLEVLEPAAARNSNGFYVSEEFARQNSVSTLSELAALGKPVVLAAGDDCVENTFCQPGLEQTYGLQISEVTGDPYGSASAKQKVLDGSAQLGLTGTTDGTLEAQGLVLLEDDKGLQAADNLVPVVNAEAADPRIAEALDELAETLTTEDLARLNVQVDGERKKPAEVAKAYVAEKGLV